MTAFPRSLIEFQQRFPDEAACVGYLFKARWPDGFVCPACGTGRAWELQTKLWTWKCAGCHRQTSVTAGTIMHHSKLPLTIWFWAAYLMTTHSNSLPRRRPGASRHCNCNPARPRLVQVDLADLRQAAPQHGGTGPQSARWTGRGRRDRDRLPQQAWSGKRWRRPQSPGQDHRRRGGRGRGWRSRPHPFRRGARLLGSKPASLHCR
jgi:transposase-like zinc ribbon protein